MGLDMYLDMSLYISPYSDKGLFNRLRTELDENIASSPFPLDGNSHGAEVKFPAMYWRKANAIHAWFIENCAGGVDDCQDVDVSIPDLSSLRDLCGQIMELCPVEDWESEYEVPSEVVEKVTELLGPQDGFFFGSTVVDHWYFRDIGKTYEVLTKLVEWLEEEWENNNFWDITYRASW